MENTQLVHFDRARQELELATKIDEVKQIRDQAEAIRQYVKQQKGSFTMQNQAAEIKLRAERKLGEMLKDIERVKPQDAVISHTKMDGDTKQTYTEVLIENDIAPITAYRWQVEAEIPEDKFEQFIAETKSQVEELTSRAALAIAMKMKHEQKKEANSNPVLPSGIFNVIVIDPPWPYGGDYDSNSHRIESPYREMSIEDLMIMNIPAADDCILWLWTTNKFMHDAYHLLEAWAFDPKTILTWVKNKMGVGYWLRGQTEHCILALKGVRFSFGW